MDVIVFTDGSCMCKRITPKAGYGVYFPNEELKNVSRPFIWKPITSQRAELYAIYTALKLVFTKLEVNTVTIYTDSKYSINSLTDWVHKWIKNGWKGENKKPIKNKDIIERIYNIMSYYKDKIKFVHVKSHTNKKDFNSIGNQIADDLATKGARKDIM